MNEWLWGWNSVLEALRAGQRCFSEVLIQSELFDKSGELLDRARSSGAFVRKVDKERLLSVSKGGKHQGVAAMATPKRYSSFHDISSVAKKRGEMPLVVVLDGVSDPQNFGAILRTCEVAGVHGVVIPMRRSVGMGATVSRASAGAMEHINVARVKNLASFLRGLREKGFWLAGFFSEGDLDIYSAELGTVPMCLVLGGEGSGIRRLVSDVCDYKLKIPQRGRVESLNVSAATAVVVYEVFRQRREKKNTIGEKNTTCPNCIKK